MAKFHRKPLTQQSIRRLCRGFLAIGMVVYLVLFLRLPFALYDRFAYMTFDLGIFDQAVWLISQGKTPFVTARGVHILGDHFSVILYLIAPNYRLFPSPKTLLFLQTFALTLGAIPAYGLTRKRLKSEPLALLFGLIYLLHPAHQWSLTYEFHPDVFATPLLVAAFYAIEAKRWRLLAASLVLTALIKESAGLTIACVGVWTLYKDRKAGIATIVFGLMMMPVAMLTVKYFNGGLPSPYFAIFRHFGSTPGEMAHNFADHPVRFLSDLFHPGNLMLTGSLMLVFCLLPLFAPETILLALPMLLINYMGGRSGMHTYEEYYFASVTPLLFLGAIKGFHRVQKWGWFLRWLFLLNLPIWAISGFFMGPLVRPIEQIYTGQAPAESIQECNAAVALIPANASVSASMALGAHLAHRTQLYLFPNPFVISAYGGTRKALEEIDSINGTQLPIDLSSAIQTGSANAEYVALCPKSSPFPLSDSNVSKLSVAILQSKKYETEYVGQYVLLLKRVSYGTATLENLARRSGKSVKSAKEVEGAYWHWYALQFPAPKGVRQ